MQRASMTDRPRAQPAGVFGDGASRARSARQWPCSLPLDGSLDVLDGEEEFFPELSRLKPDPFSEARIIDGGEFYSVARCELSGGQQHGHTRPRTLMNGQRECYRGLIIHSPAQRGLLLGEEEQQACWNKRLYRRSPWIGQQLIHAFANLLPVAGILRLDDAPGDPE